MLKELIALANEMDKRALRKEATFLDSVIKKYALWWESIAAIEALVLGVEGALTGGATATGGFAGGEAGMAIRQLANTAAQNPAARTAILEAAKRLGATSVTNLISSAPVITQVAPGAAGAAGAAARTGLGELVVRPLGEMVGRPAAGAAARTGLGELVVRPLGQVMVKGAERTVVSKVMVEAAGFTMPAWAGATLTMAAVIGLFGVYAWMAFYPLAKLETLRGQLENTARIKGEPIWFGGYKKSIDEYQPSDFGESKTIQYARFLAVAYGADGSDPSGIIQELLNDRALDGESLNQISNVAEYLETKGRKYLALAKAEAGEVND